MQSPASTLATALQGLECRVTRREADWSFDFGDRLNIAASVPWRVVTADGIAHGDEDDGQWFGLSKPVDGEARTNELLRGQRVVGVELDGHTADLHVVFDGGARLDFFNNSSGYEGWQATVGGQKGPTVIALGGGKLTSHTDVLFRPIAGIGAPTIIGAMRKVFILQHERPETEDSMEDVKLIGAYSTELSAQAAIERFCTQPGFRDYPDHFTIDAYEIDKDHWTEGFIEG